MPYIKVSFKSAKLFLEKKVGTDFTTNVMNYFFMKDKNKRYESRTEENTLLLKEEHINKIMEHPIGIEQVSNMLHVLFGVRPVPSKKPTLRKRIAEIDEIAKNAWIKFDNCYYSINKEDKKKVITEFIQGKKITKDSNSKSAFVYTSDFVKINSYITWSKLYLTYFFYKNDLYNNMLNLFETLYGSDTYKKDYTLVDFIVFLSKDEKKKEILYNFFKENKMTPLADLTIGNYDKISGFNNARATQKGYKLGRLQNNKSVKTVLLLDGDMFFKTTKEQAEIIMKGIRNATFLDGGHCKVTDKYDLSELNEYDLEEEGFVQLFN